jgi:hypothetical protein
MEPPDAPRLGRCRGKDWQRVSHGLHRPADELDAFGADLFAWRLALPPSGAFTHLTAARAYGWWLPPLPGDLPVFAIQLKTDPRPRRDGLLITRHPHPVEVVVREGLPITAPAETLLACARDLRLLDLVVLIDAALQMKSCKRSDVAAMAGLRRAGAPLLRLALTFVDGRSESARPRQRKDLRRARGLSNIGWVRRGYTSVEVLSQATSILRDADLSLGRPHRPELVRAWYALLAESLYTPSGTALFRRRIGLPTDREEWS